MTTLCLTGFYFVLLCAQPDLPREAGSGKPPKSAAPKRIDPKTDKAWEAAGAEAGWYFRDAHGSHMFTNAGAPSYLPAFKFHRFSPGVLSKLPHADEPFALFLPLFQVKDEDLKGLGQHQNVQCLFLNFGSVTDAGVEEIRSLVNLQQLYLGSKELTDAGVKKLAGLKKLRELDLANTQVTDAAFEDLKELKELEVLDLNRTQVTGIGLAALKNSQMIKRLYLVGTPMTKEGLQELATLKGLEQLFLNDTSLTDEGMIGLSATHNSPTPRGWAIRNLCQTSITTGQSA